jgi:hypothetical protein
MSRIETPSAPAEAPPASAPSRLGWRGIEIDAPAGWDLGAHHGGPKQGYICIEDGERLRARVRWRQGLSLDPGIPETVERYRRGVLKKTRGQAEFETLGEEFLPARFRKGKRVAAFTWTAGERALGAAWHCQTCRRIIVLETLYPADAYDPKAARRLLTGATCHRDDGQVLWSAYGFAFRTPVSYNLQEPSLLAGRLRFPFRAEKKGWLRVERWSLASRWFQRVPLRDWPGELLKLNAVRRLRDYDQRETETQGKPGYAFEARGSLTPLRVSRSKPVAGRVWHCPGRDKIYAVIGGGGGEGMVDSIVSTVNEAC